jgi:hypothetical protein
MEVLKNGSAGEENVARGEGLFCVNFDVVRSPLAARGPQTLHIQSTLALNIYGFSSDNHIFPRVRFGRRTAHIIGVRCVAITKSSMERQSVTGWEVALTTLSVFIPHHSIFLYVELLLLRSPLSLKAARAW